MNKQNKNICIHVCDDNPVVVEKAIKITKDLLNDERSAAEIVAYEDGNQFTERYKERKDELLKQFKEVANDVFEISAVTGENVDKLLDFMGEKVDEIPKVEISVVVEEDTGAYNNDDSSFDIFKVAKDTYIIEGGKIERIAGVTDERNSEQVIRFQNIMKGMGVFEELAKKGIKDGDTVIIGHLEFAFYSDEIFG